jgi:hypothetical protein
MTKFEQILNEILQNIEETTISPVKPATPSTPQAPRKSPNPFRRPGHNPFEKPKPKAVDTGDKMVDFFQKRLKRINHVLSKYTK